MKFVSFDTFATGLAVSVRKEFYSFVRERLRRHKTSMVAACRSISNRTKYSQTHVKNVLKPSNTYMVPWEIIRELSTILTFPLQEIYAFICSYGTTRCRSPVYNPKTLVQHTPIFDMLVAHALADGSVVRSEGRTPYFSFRQHDVVLMKSYRKQCEFVFGDIPSLYIGEDPTKTYLPAAPSKVLFHISEKSENDFLSTSAEFPQYILDMPYENQFAFLLAFFADEGHVDSTNVVIRLKNSSLADGIYAICKNLHFSTTRTTYRNGMHQVYINAESLEDLHSRYVQLVQNYPFVTLSYKEKQLSQTLYRKHNSCLRTDRKQQLLQLLEESLKTVNELARLVILTRQGVRHHIKTLMKHKRIRHIETIPGKPPEYVYALWE